MKLTNNFIKNFEEQQKDYGTKIALTNVLWLVAIDIFHDINVKSIKTTYHSNLKVLAEEQKVSKKNAKKSVLQVKWTGSSRFIPSWMC